MLKCVLVSLFTRPTLYWLTAAELHMYDGDQWTSRWGTALLVLSEEKWYMFSLVPSPMTPNNELKNVILVYIDGGL